MHVSCRASTLRTNVFSEHRPIAPLVSGAVALVEIGIRDWSETGIEHARPRIGVLDSTSLPVPYRRRLADERLSTLLEAFPAILLNGPRATGKTTTASP